jgi:hypothetical protein
MLADEGVRLPALGASRRRLRRRGGVEISDAMLKELRQLAR